MVHACPLKTLARVLGPVCPNSAAACGRPARVGWCQCIVPVIWAQPTGEAVAVHTPRHLPTHAPNRDAQASVERLWFWPAPSPLATVQSLCLACGRAQRHALNAVLRTE